MNHRQPSTSLVNVLYEMGDCLGIGRQSWIDNEWPDKILIETTITSTCITEVCIPKILDALQFFGSSITIQLGPDNWEFPSRIPDIAVLLNTIQSMMENDQLEISIEVNKDKYLRDHYSEITKNGRTILYIFTEKISLIFANSDLIQLQELIWGYTLPDTFSTPNNQITQQLMEQVVILVPEETMLYVGDYLVLIGGEYLTTKRPDWILTRKSNSIIAYNLCMEIRHNELLWPPNYPLAVTPWHFFLTSPVPAESDLDKALKHHFLFLFILFTADRTDQLTSIQQKVYYKAAYSGSEHQASVTVSNPWPAHFYLTITDDARYYLKAILDFIHDNPRTCADKLTITQLVLMDSLLGKDENLAAAEIVNKAAEIKRKLEWHWKIFIEGKITKNWQVVKEIESAINLTIKEYSNQVNELVGKLNETVLAAIGVILGSFLTAIFTDEFNALIFRIGVITYAGYVFFFPLLYSMINRWQSYQTTVDQFMTQQQSYIKLLSEAVIQEMIKTNKYDRYTRRYRLWFFISVGVYLGLILLLGLAAIIVPNLF
ncbi:MAG TPA: hypothetical protein VN376_00520 [Longilinea sp.]|nr:hypothetical protein [Longilinea sp.]